MNPENKNPPQFRRAIKEESTSSNSVDFLLKRQTQLSQDQSVTDFLLHLFDFTGRAGILEFLFFILIFLIIIWVPAFFLYKHTLIKAAITWSKACSLILFLPNIALIMRRLHDTGKSGVYIILIFIPIAGPIALLCMLLCPADNSSNNIYK